MFKVTIIAVWLSSVVFATAGTSYYLKWRSELSRLLSSVGASELVVGTATAAPVPSSRATGNPAIQRQNSSFVVPTSIPPKTVMQHSLPKPDKSPAKSAKKEQAVKPSITENKTVSESAAGEERLKGDVKQTKVTSSSDLTPKVKPTVGAVKPIEPEKTGILENKPDTVAPRKKQAIAVSPLKNKKPAASTTAKPSNTKPAKNLVISSKAKTDPVKSIEPHKEPKTKKLKTVLLQPMTKEQSTLPKQVISEKVETDERPKKTAKLTIQPVKKVGEKSDTVEIKRGDNLWNISKRRYGLGHLYPLIFDANRDQIKDPDLIYPGQVMAIPESSSKTR